jgi:8-oxo-dGTP pyrophosphatase MutT (NUDIX family)
MNSAVCIIFDNDNRILFLKRPHEDRTLPNMFCLPGGKKDEITETLEDCMIREVKEETNLDLHSFSIKLVAIVKHIGFYTATAVDLDKLKISNEHESYKFVSDLDSIDIAPITKYVVSEFLNNNYNAG